MLLLCLFTSPTIIITFALGLTLTLSLSPLIIFTSYRTYKSRYSKFYSISWWSYGTYPERSAWTSTLHWRCLILIHSYPDTSTQLIYLHYHNHSQDPSIHRMDIRLHLIIPCKPFKQWFIMCCIKKQETKWVFVQTYVSYTPFETNKLKTKRSKCSQCSQLVGAGQMLIF